MKLGFRYFFIFVVNCLLVFIAFSSNVVFAQEANEQIGIIVSNDKFANKDRYFTNGIYLTYAKKLDKDFLFIKTDNNTIQYRLGVGNEIYSPSYYSSIAVADFDRPFAGWLYVFFEIGSVKKSSAFYTSFETGITGKESLAGTLQTRFHNFLGIQTPTWEEEIPFKWLFNIKATVVDNWQLNKNNAFMYKLSSSLGTKDIFLQNQLGYYFGKFNDLQNSSRLGVVDKTATNEFYGFISAAHKYVVHNTLIQGGPFHDDTTFTTVLTKHILKIELGSTLKIKRNTFRFVYTYNTKETPKSVFHSYGTLSFLRSF